MRSFGRLGRDESAASSSLVLPVTLLLFVVIVSVTMGVMRHDATVSAKRAEAESRTGNALVQLLDQPGVPPNWEVLPTSIVERAGVRLPGEGSLGRLDPGKVERLRALTGPDLARVLGLEGYHVRVRVEPAWFRSPNGSLAELAPLPTAYVADYESGAPTSIAEFERDALRWTGASFNFTQAAHASLIEYRGVGDVFPDEGGAVLRELVPRLAGFEAVAYSGGAGSAPSIWKVIRKGEYEAPAATSWWTVTTPETLLAVGAYSPSVNAFRVTAARTHTLTLGTFDLGSFPEGSTASLDLVHHLAPGGLGLFADSASVIARCVASCLGAPADATLWSHASTDPIGTKAAFSTLSVDLSGYVGQTVAVRLRYETNAVAATGEGWFVSRVAIAAAPPGGSPSTVHENALDFAASAYDALVVGSDVNHAAFLGDGGILRVAVRDWVRAGGRLLVLGSPAADGAWLAPHFTTGGVPNPSMGLVLGGSDLSHPAVASPFALDVAKHAYAAVTYAAGSEFTLVLAGEDANQPGATVPLLAVAPDIPGYAGAVALGSGRPGRFLDPMEARRAFVNWLGFLEGHREHAEAGDSVRVGDPFGHASSAGVVFRDEAAPRLVSVTVFAWN